MEIQEFIDFIKDYGELKGKIRDEERYKIGKFLIVISNEGFCVAENTRIIYFFSFSKRKEIFSVRSLETIFQEIKDICSLFAK